MSLRRGWSGLALLGLAALATAVHPGRAAGQGVDVTRLLREAAARESQGDYDGAEAVLRRLLLARPTSSGGLFALERVLRAKGDTRAVLPAVDTFLAHDGDASGVRALKLRVLLELDSLDAVETEGARWLEAEPGSEGAYREVSRVYGRAFGPQRALDVLRKGRNALDDPDALALETGDVLASSGRVEEAVDAWVRAVGRPGVQPDAIARRVERLGDASEAAGRRLVSDLAREGLEARRAGARIAVALGLDDQALALTRSVAGTLDGRGRMAFLADMGRRARDAGMGDVAAWAYGELGSEAASPGERREFDQRLVEVSLAAGDTASALEAQRRLVASYSPGTVDRRQATAEAVRLESGSASPERLTQLLADFREAFPGAPELDDLAATVAQALLRRGDREGAASVLEGMGGPRSSLQRGYLQLDAGKVEEGRRSLLLALPGLEPAVATEVIQLVGLLGRLSHGAGAVLARAEVLGHEGRGEAAADTLVAALDDLPGAEQPAVLAEAARLASRGGAGSRAADLRTRLLETYPDAPEAAEAALALARYRARTPEGRDEAIRLLEELVLDRPDAAVAPDARRELERLRRGRSGA
ncbi:MAG: hypothetical protein PVJ02_04305 [Gemmatimonadota bacterium]|jgi:tetratricopeptide (TPR) repeat protein